MTIDRRNNYYHRCQQCGLIHSQDYHRRHQQGRNVQQQFKFYWHLIDQGKQNP